MRYRLTFKKAFSLTIMSVEQSTWLLELRTGAFHVEARDKLFEIYGGQIGETEREKLAIMPFLFSDQRRPELMRPIPTLNLTTELDLEIPASVYENWRTPSVADGIVEPLIAPAFAAYRHFTEAYRDVKYMADRRTERWDQQHGVVVPLMSWNDFVTYLFYVLEAGERATFVGSFSIGRMLSVQPDDVAFRESLQKTLDGGVPLSRVLIVNAWEELFEGDLRTAVISAATALELTLSALVTAELTRRHAGSASQIAKFTDETSNRLLATVVLAALGLADSSLRAQAADVFETRNGLVHGQKRYASHKEAKIAVDTAEAFLALAEPAVASIPPQAEGPPLMP